MGLWTWRWFLAVSVTVELCALPAGASGASPPQTGLIYWGDNSANKISEADLPTGGSGSVLNTTGATVSAPNGVSIDAAANRIYWVNATANSISEASLDGSGGSNLNVSDPTLVNVPAAIAVDPPAGKIYWVNELGGPGNTGTIAEANLNGTDAQAMSTGAATVNDPQGIAIDPTDNKIFWTNVGNNTISYADLDNTGFGANLTITGSASPVSNPVGLAVDPVARKIYWADAVNPGHISFASIDGSGSGDFNTLGASALNVPAGVAIDPAANQIYWADKIGGTISVGHLNNQGGGGDLVTTGASTFNPYFVALLEPPLAAGVPQITGGPATGSTLSCSQGSWAPDLLSGFLYRAPHTYSYQWTFHGDEILGATSSTYTAPSGGAYACQVTAANHAGAASQMSAAIAVTGGGAPPTTTGSPPPTPTSRPVLTHVGQSHRRWREGGRRPVIASVGPRVGTTFRFTVNESVRVRFRFKQRRHRHDLTRGTLSFSAHAGAHKVRFDGRLPKHKTLPIGRYMLVITVTGANSKTASKTLRFTIVKR